MPFNGLIKRKTNRIFEFSVIRNVRKHYKMQCHCTLTIFTKPWCFFNFRSKSSNFNETWQSYILNRAFKKVCDREDAKFYDFYVMYYHDYTSGRRTHGSEVRIRSVRIQPSSRWGFIPVRSSSIRTIAGRSIIDVALLDFLRVPRRHSLMYSLPCPWVCRRRRNQRCRNGRTILLLD